MRNSARRTVAAITPLLALLIGGCGSNGLSTIAASPSLAGNWGIAAIAAPSNPNQIAGLGGALIVSSTGAITGLLHTMPANINNLSTLCYATTNAIPVTGTLTSDNTLTLTSANFAGNTATVRGIYVAGSGSKLASLSNATYSISGPCGVSAQAVTAQATAGLNGTYYGSYIASTGSGVLAPPQQSAFTATFSNATTPDPVTGAYQETATAVFYPSDRCLPSPITTVGNLTQQLTGSGGIYGYILTVNFQDPISGTTVNVNADTTRNLYLIGVHNDDPAYADCNAGYQARLTTEPEGTWPPQS